MKPICIKPGIWINPSKVRSFAIEQPSALLYHHEGMPINNINKWTVRIQFDEPSYIQRMNGAASVSFDTEKEAETYGQWLAEQFSPEIPA